MVDSWPVFQGILNGDFSQNLLEMHRMIDCSTSLPSEQITLLPFMLWQFVFTPGHLVGMFTLLVSRETFMCSLYLPWVWEALLLLQCCHVLKFFLQSECYDFFYCIYCITLLNFTIALYFFFSHIYSIQWHVLFFILTLQKTHFRLATA